MEHKGEAWLTAAVKEARKRFPGSYEVRLDVWRESEPVPHPVEGVPDTKWQTLARLRATFGGEEGYLTDPQGKKHRVSLAQWAHEDPERTYCVPTWVFVPDSAHLQEWKQFWRHRFNERSPKGRPP